jgi:molybdopterin-guanine dinucleotide biosynthesis protein A
VGGDLGVIILAGGGGRRIGPNKPLLEIGGRSMLARAVATALTVTTDVVVVAGTPEQGIAYRAAIPDQVVLVHDKIQERGPLIGLYSGMECLASRYAAVLPCDCPFVMKQVVLHLYDTARGADAAVPTWSDGKIEPLHSVFQVDSAKSAAIETMKAEMDTIREMIQQMNTVRFVPIESIKPLDPRLLTFFNVNTLEDLDKAREIWPTHSSC